MGIGVWEVLINRGSLDAYFSTEYKTSSQDSNNVFSQNNLLLYGFPYIKTSDSTKNKSQISIIGSGDITDLLENISSLKNSLIVADYQTIANTVDRHYNSRENDLSHQKAIIENLNYIHKKAELNGSTFVLVSNNLDDVGQGIVNHSSVRFKNNMLTDDKGDTALFLRKLLSAYTDAGFDANRFNKEQQIFDVKGRKTSNPYEIVEVKMY